MCRKMGDIVEIAPPPLIPAPLRRLNGVPGPAIPSPRTMKLGITSKVFLAVLLVALAVLLAMGVAGRWSFTRGFVGYMD